MTRTLAKAALLLAASLAAAPLSAQIVVFQRNGDSQQERDHVNAIIAIQSGRSGPGASAQQNGDNNQAGIGQSGPGQNAHVAQVGCDHNAVVTQSGAPNAFFLVQRGCGTSADVNQTGGQAGFAIVVDN